MFPKFDEVPIRTYLIVLAKMRRPSTIPVARIVEVLVEQDDVGGVLGHVGRGLDRDSDVGVVQRDRVVDAVAEESDRRAEGSLGLDQPRFLLWGDAREDRRVRQRGCELRVVELIELGAGERPVDGEADVGADLLRDAVVVAGDDLHLHVEAPEPVERRRGRRPSDDRRTSGSPRGRRSRSSSALRVAAAVGRARRDGDHAAAGRELAVEHGLRLLGRRPRSGRAPSRCALDDDLPLATGALDEDRRQPPLIVERKRGQPPSAVDAGRAGARGVPERLVELVAADHVSVGEGRVVAEQPGAQDRIRRPAVGVQSARRT